MATQEILIGRDAESNKLKITVAGRSALQADVPMGLHEAGVNVQSGRVKGFFTASVQFCLGGVRNRSSRRSRPTEGRRKKSRSS